MRERKWNLDQALVILMLTVLLQGCEGVSHCHLASQPGNVTDGILATLSTGQTSYTAGQNVLLTFAVANAEDQAQDLVFGTGQQYEFYVLDSSGTVVWQWSVYNHLLFTQSLVPITIDACSYYSFTTGINLTVAWKGDDNNGNALPPGTYTVYAAFTTSPAYESNRLTIALQ